MRQPVHRAGPPLVRRLLGGGPDDADEYDLAELNDALLDAVNDTAR